MLTSIHSQGLAEMIICLCQFPEKHSNYTYHTSYMQNLYKRMIPDCFSSRLGCLIKINPIWYGICLPPALSAANFTSIHWQEDFKTILPSAGSLPHMVSLSMTSILYINRDYFKSPFYIYIHVYRTLTALSSNSILAVRELENPSVKNRPLESPSTGSRMPHKCMQHRKFSCSLY